MSDNNQPDLVKTFFDNWEKACGIALTVFLFTIFRK